MSAEEKDLVVDGDPVTTEKFTHYLVAMYDSKMEKYTPVHPVAARGAAVRGFSDVISGDNDVGRHPEDFSLWILGLWNESTGEVWPHARECIARGVDFKE